MLSKLWESLSKDGPITFLINLFCVCILYLFGYLVYSIFKFISLFQLLTPGNPITYPVWVITDKLAYFAFLICIFLTSSLGTLFLVLYFVYKAIEKMGFAFIIYPIPIFKESWETGLFGLFDDIFGILGNNEYILKRFGLTFQAAFKFLKTFLKKSFGIVFDGYELDDDYLDAALEVFLNKGTMKDGKMCEKRKQEIGKILQTKTPIVKIQFNENVEEQKPMSQMETIKYNNCVKMNTVEIPSDANTLDRLKLIFQNEMAKKACMAGGVISGFTDNLQDLNDTISESVQNSYKSFTSGVSAQYTKNTKEMDAVKEANTKK